MAKGLTPQEQANKWSANAQAAVAAYKQGIAKVTSSPTQKAAANLQTAKMNYAARVDDGSMAAKLNAVTLGDWQQITQNKGGANYPTGIQNALPKMVRALNKWVPIRNAIAAQVNQMPNASYADRKARMNAMIDGMHAAKQANPV